MNRLEQTCIHTYIHIASIYTWLGDVADEVTQVTHKHEVAQSIQSPNRKESTEQLVEFHGSMYVCMYVCKGCRKVCILLT